MKFGTKANADVLELKKGDVFIGRFKGESDKPWLDKATGEQKNIKQYHFTQLDEKGNDIAPVILFADAGMQSACNSALMKEGEIIKLVKGDKTDLGGGRTMNTYEVYKAE